MDDENTTYGVGHPCYYTKVHKKLELGENPKLCRNGKPYQRISPIQR